MHRRSLLGIGIGIGLAAVPVWAGKPADPFQGDRSSRSSGSS